MDSYSCIPALPQTFSRRGAYVLVREGGSALPVLSRFLLQIVSLWAEANRLGQGAVGKRGLNSINTFNGFPRSE
jgi:hypothetical protein